MRQSRAPGPVSWKPPPVAARPRRSLRPLHKFCEGCQLILTHTNAGVDVLRGRFQEHGVARAKYHVDTIAGWAWGWVRMYPNNANYRGTPDIATWIDVYPSMCNLLHKDFVKQGILNSYTGVIIDEYQDCTASMHAVISELKKLLPCRVLGDELQGIFDFREKLVDWSDVRAEFVNDLGILETPHRWIKAGNEDLGKWLLGARREFGNGSEPMYRGSPIAHQSFSYGDLSRRLIGIVRRKEGRVCVIRSKSHSLPAALETALVNHGLRVLEPNDLTVLQELVRALCDDDEAARPKAALTFFERAFGGLGQDEKRFLEAVFRNKVRRATRADRRELCEKHKEGVTANLLLDVLEYIAKQADVPCKLKEFVSALKCVLEGHLKTGAEIKGLYADEIAERKYHRRSKVYRCIGSTLLVKGLEFDHAIVVRPRDWQKGWGTHKDLYVALTRGGKSVTLIDLAQ